MGEHRRLRRAGGAAREQQRGDGARLELRDAERLAVEVVVERERAVDVVAVGGEDDAHRRDRRGVDRSPRLARHRADHHRHGAHRGELLTDLCTRAGRVQRNSDRAETDHREIRHDEVTLVAEQQADPVADTYSLRGERGA